MSRHDLRWIRNHPLRWVRICWWHWTIALILFAKGIVITDDLWRITAADRYWPIILGAAGMAAAASAIAPLDDRLQTFTAAVLLGVATARAATYLGVWIAVGTDGTVDTLARAFTLHWIALAFLAVRWPVLSTTAGAHLAVASARDDDGAR